jgi:hypothetical protein
VPVDELLPTPSGITILRVNKSTWTTIELSWTTSEQNYKSFLILLSTDPTFPQDEQSITRTYSTTKKSIVVPTIGFSDLQSTIHYAKVKSVGDDSSKVSKDSPTSESWRSTGKEKSCFLDSQYLDTSSLNPTHWDCKICPVGASCTGSLTFQQVQAKFGWSQCPKRGNGDKNKTFARCMFPPACLGGTNTALLGKYKVNASTDIDPAKCDGEICDAKCSEIGYVNGSRLCGQCKTNYSRGGLVGQCKECPPFEENVGVAVAGLLGGILGLIVLIQITLSDGGTLDESDGAKVCLLFIALLFL